MDKYHYTLDELRREFGMYKEIPAKYEEEILTALSHYPELKDEQIHFVLASAGAMPYSTKLTFSSYFGPKNKRIYTITILERADFPESEAIIKHLNRKMRIGVLGHELGHVLQYKNCEPLKLLKNLVLYVIKPFKRKLERGADKAAISHGLGEELLTHAEYIRLIPEYMNKRPELDTDYLKPEEIIYLMAHSDKIATA